MAPHKSALLIAVGIFISTTRSSSATPFTREVAKPPFFNNHKGSTDIDVGSALNVPRGGDISHVDAAKKVYYVLTGVHGAVSALAPTETGKILYNGAFDIEEDSLAEFCMSYVGTCLISCVYMALLAFSTDMDAPTIVAHGTYPFAIMNFRYLLQDKFVKHGWQKGVGLYTTLSSIMLPLGIRSGRFNSDLLAKIDIICPLLMGAVGFFSRDLGMKVWGHKGVAECDEVTVALSGWLSSAMFQVAIIAASLLAGFEAKKAVGYSALFFLIDLVNNNHIQGRNGPLKLEPAANYIMALILAGVSYALLC